MLGHNKTTQFDAIKDVRIKLLESNYIFHYKLKRRVKLFICKPHATNPLNGKYKLKIKTLILIKTGVK